MCVFFGKRLQQLVKDLQGERNSEGILEARKVQKSTFCNTHACLFLSLVVFLEESTIASKSRFYKEFRGQSKKGKAVLIAFPFFFAHLSGRA